jgi:hypothetical protein
MILMNLAIGLPTMLLCLILQATFSFWSVQYYARQAAAGLSGEGFLRNVRPLLQVMIILMLGNILQILIWGGIFVWLGEFEVFYEAVYHSAVNFASLGYGDIVMSTPWKLLGPLEALNGVLMLGMTAAALMAILQNLLARFGVPRRQD